MSALIEDDEGAAKREAMEAFAFQLREIARMRKEAVGKAVPALARLVQMCGQKTGQSYKVRALLYSLWNGCSVSLLEVVSLDWSIRCDVLAVTLAFGDDDFFYGDIEQAFTDAGLFKWFIEAGNQVN